MIPKHLTITAALALGITTSLLAQTIQPGHDTLLTAEGNLFYLDLAGGDQFLPTSLLNPAYATYDPISEQLLVLDYGWFGFGNASLYSVDLKTGLATLIGDTGSDDYGPMAVEPSTGTIYFFHNDYLGEVYTLSRLDGSRTYAGSWGDAWTSCTFIPQTGDLYAVRGFTSASGPPSSSLTLIDFPTHTSTNLGLLDGWYFGIGFDSQGVLYGSRSTSSGFPYWNDPLELVEIDVNTLTGSSLGQHRANFPFAGLTFIPPTNATLSLAPANPVSGQALAVHMVGAKAEASSWLAWSLVGTGSTVVPQLGVTLGIASPLGNTGPLVSGIDGVASFSGTLPPLPGLQLWMQSAQTGVVSDVITFTLL